MDQISSLIRVLIPLIIVAIAVTLVQRKWGSKTLVWVWIASTVLMTGVTVSWIFYTHGLPSSQAFFENRYALAFLGAYLFMTVAIASGGVILHVAVFGPRPPQDSLAEINYFPYNLPNEKVEDTNGLAGILRRYHELLTTFLTDLDTALASTLFNPYRSRLRDFLSTFSMHRPSYRRQLSKDSHQFTQVPNALRRDLAGADVVLAELETLTAAQLSAIEECHRVNVRRLKQRTILRWDGWGKITVVCAASATAISYGVVVVEKMAGVKPSDFWPLIRDIPLTGANLQSNITLVVIFALVLFLIGSVSIIMTFLPILRRVQAFEDILTIAKAYRKESGGTTKPSEEPSLTAMD